MNHNAAIMTDAAATENLAYAPNTWCLSSTLINADAATSATESAWCGPKI